VTTKLASLNSSGNLSSQFALNGVGPGRLNLLKVPGQCESTSFTFRMMVVSWMLLYLVRLLCIFECLSVNGKHPWSLFEFMSRCLPGAKSKLYSLPQHLIFCVTRVHYLTEASTALELAGNVLTAFCLIDKFSLERLTRRGVEIFISKIPGRSRTVARRYLIEALRSAGVLTLKIW